MLLAIRMLLLDVAADRQVRIVHVEPGLVWLHPIGSTGWPSPSPTSVVVNDIANGDWLLRPEEIQPTPTTALALGRQEQRLAQMRPLLNPAITGKLMRPSRFDLIKDRVRELEAQGMETSYQNLCNLLRAWWDGGMTYAALATRYDRCGAPGRTRKNAGRKVGRPNTITPADVGTNVTEADLPRLEIAACMHLKGGVTLAQAHRSMCLTHYSEFREDAAGRPERVLLKERPSLGQLRFHISKYYPEAVRRRMKRGEHATELADRAITGRADHDVNAPGDRYEIDATVADTYLVSAYDETRIVGRPVIYSVVDVFSRMVVGVYVGFEGPSWAGAMMALVNMVTDKQAFCASLDIPLGPDEWPCHHAPVEIMADRGELMSARLVHRIVDDLHINITNVRPYRGDMKAIVERTHGTLQRTWGPFNPGYVKPDFGERGAIDYRKKGALTLREFTRQHVLAVLVHNAKPSTTHDALPEMVSEELPAAPIDFWRFGVKNLGPRLHHLSVEQVALAVMPREKARVTPRGIKFRGGFYDCAYAQRDAWYEQARFGQTWEVDVSFNPGDLGCVYLQTDAQTVQMLDLLPTYGDRAGKALFEFEEQEIRRKQAQAAGVAARTIPIAEREAEMKQIGKAGAERLASKLKANPDAGDRTKGIRENRKLEKAAQRKVQPLAPATVASAKRLSPPANPLERTRKAALARLKQS